MLSTPQTITVNAVATDCHRVEQGKGYSVYKSTDGNLSFKVSHQETKTRVRRMARLDQRIIAADPLTAENTYQSAGIYLVVDEPAVGFSDAQLGYLVDALKAWLTSTNYNIVLAGRS